MTPVLLPRQTHVADHHDEAAARNQDAEAMCPHLVELVEEFLVVDHRAKLSVVRQVLLECPVRGAGDDKMDRLVGDELKRSAVADMNLMFVGIEATAASICAVRF